MGNKNIKIEQGRSMLLGGEQKKENKKVDSYVEQNMFNTQA